MLSGRPWCERDPTRDCDSAHLLVKHRVEQFALMQRTWETVYDPALLVSYWSRPACSELTLPRKRSSSVLTISSMSSSDTSPEA